MKRQKARGEGQRHRGEKKGTEVSSVGGGKYALPKGSDTCSHQYTMIRQNHPNREVDTRLGQRTPNSNKLNSLF